MEELENLESTESDVEQKRILEQVVIDKDLPVTMRTIQVLYNIYACKNNSL